MVHRIADSDTRLVLDFVHQPLTRAQARRYRNELADALVPVERWHPAAARVLQGWVVQPLGDGWTAAFRVVVQNGAPTVAELRVYPSEEGSASGAWSGEVLGVRAGCPTGGLSARLLRRVRLGATTRVLGDLMRRLQVARPRVFDTHLRPEGLGVSKLPPTRGRGLPFYAKVAHLYVGALTRERPTTAEIARQLTVSASTARAYVYRARRLGLLTPTHRGKGGGSLTWRAAKGRGGK